MSNPKQVCEQLITTLKAASTLKTVKKFYFGEPPFSRTPMFPWAFVEWQGGIMEAGVYSQQVIRDVFSVTVVCKHIDFEKAEKDAYELTETIEAVLDNDVTINGLVSKSWVSNREKQKAFVANDYSVVAVKITLSTWRRE